MTASNSTPASTSRILHIGLGSFHRAHQAVYLHALRQTGDKSWSITAGNIRDDMAPVLSALIAQQGHYTLETVSPAGERRYERITSIATVLPFDAQLSGLIDVGAQDNTRIISFTVTEAGYYLDGQHQLDLRHDDLRSDIEQGSHHTIYGALTLILRERLARGGAPVTLQNCDNLRSNGVRVRAALLEFLTRRGERALHDWVKTHTSCPDSMVDRITPRPPPELAERVHAATGWDDQAPVMGEDFIQWVIQDDFIAGRPAWEKVGAQLVDSVHDFEEAKIRVLNATHSCVAWAGALRGLSFIHDDMAVPAIRQMAFDYVTQDVIPCLDTEKNPSRIDLPSYRDKVLARFGNPHVCDTNQRVAMDGFSKIPGFIVPTLRERIAAQAPLDASAMLPALFFTFLQRWHLGALPFAYLDGVMDGDAAHAMFESADPLDAFCKHPMLWGPLAGNPALTTAIRQAVVRVQQYLQQG
jgi:D-arabinitol 4-dehydrogenase